MAETDLSAWLLIADAAQAIGCSTRTIERLARARKLEQRLRPQAGSPAVAVFNPDDVARIAVERRPAPTPFVLDGGQESNGNGRAAEAGIATLRKPEGVFSGDAVIRGLALLISKALQSPPSPPVSESVAETLWVTIQEAAAILNFPQADVRRLLASGELKARKTGRGGWRIRRKDLEAL